jgi:hypothetical protein
MPFDLNTLYTRYDSTGTNSGAAGTVGAGTGIKYYGYSSPGTQDTTTSFSIKKVYNIANVEYVDWSGNAIADYTCSWTNRNFYFATPSNIAVTSTYSLNSSFYDVTFAWAPGSTGSSRYNVILTENGRIIRDTSKASDYINNPYNNTNSLTLINQTSITLNRCLAGKTYAISIYGYNGYGVTTTVTSSVNL